MVSFSEYVPNRYFLKWRKISFIRCFRIRLHIKSVRHQGHFHSFNTLRPRKMDGISQTTFSDAFSRMKNMWISLKIPLKFVPKGPINNIPALVQIMGWRRTGDKPLSEPMMVRLPTHICVTRPQWVNFHQMNAKWSLLIQHHKLCWLLILIYCNIFN